MLMQHIGVGYFGYYRATAYAMKHSLMPEIAKLRMKALNFWDKHGIRAAADAFDGHCCKVSDEAAFCLIQRPYISKTLLT
ncbi:hypothetical protein ACH7DH_07790, partial [Klebsiella pneumoniae]|nr:hypothetical protein [Klebsiella pneumoniae]